MSARAGAAIMALAGVVWAGAADLAFLERFALAEDRGAVLAELVPGTEDFYFFHCLHAQHEGRLDEVDRWLEAWVDQYGETAQVVEIRNRQALLRYGEAPEFTLAYLKERLGLHFIHQAQVPGAAASLPSSLEADATSRETLLKRTLNNPVYAHTVQGFTPHAYDWLVRGDLDPLRLRDLLEHLGLPDYPNLAALVARDLDAANSGGFGSLPIHQQLLLEQLDELLRLKPELIHDEAFITAWVKRLRPSNDLVYWRQDPAARGAYLERLAAFTERLAPAHNTLKAHVLYHRLAHDMGQGVYDRARFLEYVSTPRQVDYVRPEFLAGMERGARVADLSQNYWPVTGLVPVGSDEALVRAYLMHFFLAGDSIEPFKSYIRESYLRRLYAETMLLHGEGELEPWYAWLDASTVEALTKRVDVEFAPENPERFTPDEPVSLRLWVKNVDMLIVKVFEIDEANYYRQFQRPVNTDIDLDGVVPNHEEVVHYDEPPLRRVARTLDFPQLTGRGVWVIECIGNGRSSRAVVEKGQLHFMSRTGPAGQTLTVFDERGTKLPDASVWFSGRTYEADRLGEIVLPFSTAPGDARVVLMHGDFATLDTLQHEGETYALHAGFHVDRESLRTNRTASVGIRPRLTLNGTRVPVRLLSNAVLTITAQTHDGISSTEQIRELVFSDEDLVVQEFQVPENLARLHVTFAGTVERLTSDEPVELSASTSVEVNGIDLTQQMAAWFLVKSGEEYALELRDKTGLMLPGHRASLRLQHVDFTDPVHTELMTDAEGRIHLGALRDIESLAVAADGMREQDWRLDESYYDYRAVLQGSTASPLRIPYVGPTPEASVQPFWLLEVRDGAYVADRSAWLRLEGGYIVVEGVPAGDYVLDIKPLQRQISIRLTEGVAGPYYVASEARLLDATYDTPAQIESVTADDDVVTIAVAGADESTRVHVTATRFAPDDPNGLGFDGGTVAGLIAKGVRGGHALYQSGRDIGDEYRYILERRFATKYPGNMLDRPSLLLNPWARQETDASQAEEAAAEAPAAAPMPSGAASEDRASAEPEEAFEFAPEISPSFDFLDGDAVTKFNLRVNDEGTIVIPRSEFGGRHHLHIVVTDGESTIARSVALDMHAMPVRDLRLASTIDPSTHAVEQKSVRVLGAGDELEVKRSSEARVQVYDTIPRVYALYMTLNPDANLREFGFIARWPKLSPEEKLLNYSKYASHELNFFLYHKDRAFFDEVVRPYLEQKYTKQFMDAWLLGYHVTPYLEPWRYAQLNTVERILLAQRIEDEGARTAGAIRDQVELLPPDPRRFTALFMTALYGGSLSGRGAGYAEEAALGVDYFQIDSVGTAAGGGFGGGGATEHYFADAGAELVPMAANEPPPEFVERRTRVHVKQEAAEHQLGRRAAYRALYQSPEATREWVENHYYKQPLANQHAGLITANAFWLDYAEHGKDGSFLSAHMAEATRNFAEMMLALAVLDLPFEAEDHTTEQSDAAFTLRAGSPLVAYFKDIQPVAGTDGDTPVLVSQNFFRVDDRYRFEGSERFDRFVRGEFLTRVVYGCQVTVTNPTSTPHEIEVLRQIPQGALPVNSGRYTRSERMRLEPFSTATLEYYFYFPRPGDFPHYPVHVSEDGALLAYAEAETMHVVEVPSTVDRRSWQYVSQQGTSDEVLEFLRTENLHRVDLSALAWRLRDRDFFAAVLEVLKARHVFDSTVWGFAVFHNEPEAISTLLQFRDDFVMAAGPWLESPLLRIDAEARRAYEHVEYAPLINPRAHRLNTRWTITNDQLRAHYEELMTLLAHKPVLDTDDWLAITYYMLLQDRVDEALAYFGRVSEDRVASRVQYDYLNAYLAMYREAPEEAVAIAERYGDYPVKRWREMFADVRRQVAEIAGAAADASGERLGQDRLAATEPRLEFDIKDDAIVIHHEHVANATIGFFPIDVEMLFTRNPFDPAKSGVFAGLEPALVETVEFAPGATVTEAALPETFARTHVVIQIESAGLRRSEVRYASAMVVQAIERYGQVQVREASTAQPLSKVYVKVFARMKDGRVAFYKDGYTDLRGRFDYASSSTLELVEVQEFAVLVLGEASGAEVLRVTPPAR